MHFTKNLTTRRRLRSLACGATCFLYAFAGHVSAQSAGPGATTSPASASARAEPLVSRGLTALHYFEYGEANEALREARVLDPGSVMACWGEAMTYHQTLWRNEN